MRFINYQDLSATILNSRHQLPKTVDLVVGVPRSGMVPASMIATQLNIPLADTQSFLDGKMFEYGRTKAAPNVERALSDTRTVLIIDDVIGSGKAIRDLKNRISLQKIRGNLIYCAVYGVVKKHPDVDVVLEHIDTDYCFQWNFAHHQMMKRACVDIDGVLCSNPQAHENFEGRSYLTFLDNALSLHRTSGKIGWLVTSRLEQHRSQTERWLAANGVDYENLVMATPEEKEDSSAYKARIYNDTGAAIFIESELEDAANIARISGMPVICIENMSLIAPGSTASQPTRKTSARPSWRRRKSHIKLAARRMAGDGIYARIRSVYRMVRRYRGS